MSDLIEGVLLDAQSLSWRVKSSDVTADRLIEQANVLTAQVQAMKRFREEVASLNETGQRNPRAALIHSINQENLHMRQLQQENRELSHCLEEYHNAIELIMAKYRRQVGQLMTVADQNMSLNSRHKEDVLATIDSVSLLRCERKIEEMAAVMRQAADADIDADQYYRQIISQLQVENKGLRELLRISREYGSSRSSAPSRGNDTVIRVGNSEEVTASPAQATVVSCNPPSSSTMESSLSDVAEPIAAGDCAVDTSCTSVNGVLHEREEWCDETSTCSDVTLLTTDDTNGGVTDDQLSNSFGEDSRCSPVRLVSQFTDKYLHTTDRCPPCVHDSETESDSDATIIFDDSSVSYS